MKIEGANRMYGFDQLLAAGIATYCALQQDLRETS